MHPVLMWSWLLLAFSPLWLLAQAVPFETTLYYETAATIPTQNLPSALTEILAYSQAHPQKAIIIQGHTDNQGTAKQNIMLSRARAIYLVQQLLKAGIAQERLTIKALGEQYPLCSNEEEASRKFNRRVEVFITAKKQPVYFSQWYKNQQLKQAISPKAELLVIKNPREETFWTTSKGTKIYIPAHAFEGAKGPVTLAFKEAYEFSEMLLHGLSTVSAQGLLTTGGMFELKATNAQGQELALKASKQIGLQIPTDSVLPQMQLYNRELTPVADNWTNPRPLRATATVWNNPNNFVRNGIWEREVPFYQECATLEEVFQPLDLDEAQLLKQLQATKENWESYTIPPAQSFPTAALEQALEESKLNEKLIEDQYISSCENIFCQIKEAFQRKKLQTAAQEAAAQERQQLQAEQAQLEAEIKGKKALAIQHKASIEQAKEEKEELYQIYLLAKERWENKWASPISMVDFEKETCHKKYPNMPDTLHPIAEKDYHFPIFYYSKKIDSLQHYYPALEPLIAQALFGVDSYKEGIRLEQYNLHLMRKELEPLKANFPEKEQEFCQALYQVDTYEEALRIQLYETYCKKRDVAAIKREFPEKEQEFCKKFYGVENFQAADKVIREINYVFYCQQYKIQELEEDFPEREQEACQVMYGVNTFAAAYGAKARAANLKDKFYRLQLTNASLGRWKNLDYLKKGVRLLAQQTVFQTPLSIYREEYLIYSDTKAINIPSRKEAKSSSLTWIVSQLEHTFISYYALNDQEVAFAATSFVGEQDKDIPLDYKTLSVEEFVEVLRGM